MVEAVQAGTPEPLRIGVLAIQGAFCEHVAALKRADPSAHISTIRTSGDFDGGRLDALVIPGGESTSIAIVAERVGLLPRLREWVREERPTMGTCAGLILLSNDVVGAREAGQPLIGGLDCRVHRNYYGAQQESFTAQLTDVHCTVEPSGEQTGIFIRAPLIESVSSDAAITVLARVRDAGTGFAHIAAVRQGNVLATTFHPELSGTLAWHEYFVNMVREYKKHK